MAVADDDLSGQVYGPKGYAQHTTTTPVQNLESDPATGNKLSECKPGKPFRALIQAEAQDIRWTDDGETVPTAAIGMLLKANTVLEYEGDLSKFQFIQTTAGAILNVSFYGI